MARLLRKKSAMDIYHVIIRGNNKQIVFTEDDDFISFLDTLSQIKEDSGCMIFSYCLMHNHVHLLIKEGEESLSDTMKKLELRFVSWYNRKYQRCGCVFQGRFTSEPITSTNYFLAAFRYIMQNPMNAYMEKYPGYYPWSSFYAYFPYETEMDIYNLSVGLVKPKVRKLAKEYAQDIVDVDLPKSYFATNETMLEFLMEPNKDICAEYYPMPSISDEEAINLMYRLTGVKTPYDFQKMVIKDRDEYICTMKTAGYSKQQINRYTGVPIYSINKAIKQKGTDLQLKKA